MDLDATKLPLDRCLLQYTQSDLPTPTLCIMHV